MSFTRKCSLTVLCGLLTFAATFASVAPNALIHEISLEFGSSSSVGTLILSLMVAGYCLGPILWGPLSERIGRRTVFLLAFAPCLVLQVGCALSKNMPTLLVLRFLSGCFAAAPISNCGGVLADIWEAGQRGTALSIFTLAPFAGPAVGPLIGAMLLHYNLHWTWVFWVLSIFAAVTLLAVLIFLPETHGPTVLSREVKRLNKAHPESRYVSELHSGLPVLSKMQIAKLVLVKPFVLFFLEPMLAILTIYAALIYGIMYLLFTAVPTEFTAIYGFNAIETSSVFLALFAGGSVATFSYALFWNRRYTEKLAAAHPLPLAPEIRLTPLVISAPFFSIAIVWFGCTLAAKCSPALPISAIVLFGFTCIWMFVGIQNYVVDTYLATAASALAVMTVVRSLFGAIFPLFGKQMFISLGPRNASIVLGLLALLFVPAPFVFQKYGKVIRAKSKTAIVREEAYA